MAVNIVEHEFIYISRGINTYMIVCPDGIRPGMTYTIHYTKLKMDMPNFHTKAGIFDSSDNLVATDGTYIDPNVTSAVLTLQVPRNITSDTYTLNVKASEGLYSHTKPLIFMPKHMSIFIQTDKAMYKPGQLVQYRVFVTNPDLSIHGGSMDVIVLNPGNTAILQWKNVERDNGVYKGQFRLSDQPTLGDWKIEVNVDGTKETQVFEVAEYVLPKFDVKVFIPSFGLTSDQYLAGKVESKYTFGKGVVGTVRLNITERRNINVYQTSFPINGVSKFSVETTLLAKLFGGSLRYSTLTVTAEVEEDLTSVTRTDSDDIQYYDHAEKLVFMDGPENFKPGLNYTAYVFVSDQDDKPLSIPGSTVTISVTMKTESSVSLKPITADFDVPINGIIAYTFSIPVTVADITIKSYTKQNSVYKYLSKFHSLTGTYIQVSVDTSGRNPQTGKSCTFKVLSTNSGIKVNYVIVAKSKIIHKGTVKIGNRVKTASFSVKLDPLTSPKAKCIVYWVHPGADAEVIADSIEFNVKRNYNNKVNIAYVKRNGQVIRKSKTGKSVKVRVKAYPGSHCHLLTVDQSVKLLKTGNDITPSRIDEEMESFESTPPTPCNFRMGCLRSYYPVPIGGIDVTSIFQNSGMLVFTDANLYNYEPPYYAIPMMEAMMRNTDGMVMESGTGSPRVRSDFPETWLFESAIADANGVAYIKSTVPDTVTTWVSSAFAVHDYNRFGVALDNAELKSFMKFFVRLDLPYSVIRNEQVILQANVFNFFSKPLQVTVKLLASDSFEAIFVTQNLKGGVSTLSFRNEMVERTITVNAGQGVAVNFPIRPTVIGNIDIEIEAVAGRTGDAVRKQLLVEPEGIPESYNIPIFIQLDETIVEMAAFSTSKQITLPDDVVPGSVRIQISAMGDLMGPSITGLTSLLRMPYGCGEQNMITFVPNIVVIKYLEAVNNLQPEDETKAKEFMLSGYQRELTYRHTDGSFSAFGNSDPSGSTWLTAFVVKSFAQAKPYIYIDPTIMKQSIEWLLSQYTKSGTFFEPGNVIHKDMQGGSATGVRNLATYTIISLMESSSNGYGNSVASLDAVIGSAIGVLEYEMPNMTDIYQLAISSYALAYANSPVVEDVLVTLEALSMEDEETGGIYWKVAEDPVMSEDQMWIPPYMQARAQNIEATAYVLLAYSSLGRVTAGLPVMKWLTAQRNANGGFGSTQDTCIALQALAEYAALIYSDDFSIHIDVSEGSVPFFHHWDVTNENALVYQTVQAPDTCRRIDVGAIGNGIALVEISVNYNVMADPIQPLFKLGVSYTDETVRGFKLRTCFRWLGSGTSGMSVLEIKLLSGFSAEKLEITPLRIMKRVEDGNKALVIYLDEVPSDVTNCLEVPMVRDGLVAGQQPAMVKIFDYYDPGNLAYSMYQPELLKNSGICQIDPALGCE